MIVCSAIKLVSGTAVTLLPCFTDRTKIFENWHSCKFSITGSTHFLVDANEHTSMKLEEGILSNFLNTNTRCYGRCASRHCLLNKTSIPAKLAEAHLLRLAIVVRLFLTSNNNCFSDSSPEE